MQKEALFYKKLKNKIVQCELCPHLCTIANGKRGKCRARENQDGTLIALGYGKPCATALDPIEKKPFADFYPGSMTLTLAVAGCNLTCKNCQNWQISQEVLDYGIYDERSPEEIVKLCTALKSSIISFSFTEPSIFYEFMLNISQLAHEGGIQTAMISNGFINPEPLKKLLPFIDAFNIDLKSMSDEFYRENCGARLAPVLEILKIIHKSGKHLEITNLIIPGFNDTEEEIKKLVLWVKNNLDENVPLHFSAFYPMHKMINVPATRAETVIRAAEIARKMGMRKVYTGNI